MIATAHRLICLGTLALAAVLVGHPEAAAQRAYKSDDVDRSLSNRRRAFAEYLTTGAGDRTQFESYLRNFYLPSMAQSSPDALGKLDKLSSDLFKRYLHKGLGEPQKWASDQVFEWGKRVTMDRGYDPAVRLNALLIVGRIDDAYNKDDPTPSAAANEFLCRVARGSAAQARVPRYLLTGSLTGLERHTRHSRNLERRQLAQTARTLLTVMQGELAGDYAEGVKGWVYLQTGTAIANFGSAGRNGSFAVPLAKRAADESLSLETRAELASLLSGMRGSAPVEALAKPIVLLAAAVAEQESEIAVQYESTQVGGRGNALTLSREKHIGRIRSASGQAGRGEQVLVREPLVAILSDLQAGVQAANRLAGGNGQPMLIEIGRAIQPALEAASDSDNTDIRVAGEVRRMARAIETVAAPLITPEDDEEDELEEEAIDLDAPTEE